MHLYTDRSFDAQTVPKAVFTATEFDNCVFDNCDLQQRDLSNARFVDCRFFNCNLSMAKITSASFTDVEFQDCKLLGLRFDECSDFLFSVRFTDCQLDLASFYKRKLRKQRFVGCTLRETDFSDADLSQAVFDGCDLINAIFDNTLLENADVRTSRNLGLDPDRNHISGLRIRLEAAPGLLSKYRLDIES